VFVKTATDTENWRKKYFDSLTSLENEQRQFRAMEAALKRLAGRLCSASLGQSPRLDEQIKKLQNAIRRETTSDELDQLTPALTEAIQALDRSGAAPALVVTPPIAPPAPAVAAAQPIKPPPESPREAVVVDERVRAILAALLVELRRDARRRASSSPTSCPP
jgi:hypothetical protein